MLSNVLSRVLSLGLVVTVFSDMDDDATATVLYPADSPWDVSAAPVEKIVSPGNTVMIHLLIGNFIMI